MSVCGLVTGPDGELLVAVAGGTKDGMEAWNPVDGSVRWLTPDFPKAFQYGIPQLLSVKDGRYLIFYEAEYHYRGVYRYTGPSNTWTKIGEMTEARNDFAALPVQGISCS